MTYRECVIVSAYTGFLMCDFDDVHKYIEEKMGIPVLTHELADKKYWDEIRKAVKPDFLALCQHGPDYKSKPEVNRKREG